MYAIHMGIPEMKEFWETQPTKVKSAQAGKNEQKLYRQTGKAMRLLSENPQHLVHYFIDT